MKIKPIVEKALNKQITEEMYSSYIYLSMSAYLESINLPGFAKWMKAQWQEETIHAMKIFNYIIERGGKVELETIKEPPKSWKSVKEIFETAYKHEQYITAKIASLVELSTKEKDHATTSFLQWYVNEQVEEEASADLILQKINMVKEMSGGLYLLDKEISSRPIPAPVIAGIIAKE
jgi:ferritin